VGQNLNSTTFQYFSIFTSVGIIYVVVTFALDFLFRSIERTLATPPRGRVALLVGSRKRKRVAEVVSRLGLA
jgi:hypothetical protein